jgi:hypothetical protein
MLYIYLQSWLDYMVEPVMWEHNANSLHHCCTMVNSTKIY